MNSLEDIYKAVREMIYLISTAYTAGMYECIREVQKGNILAERWRIEKDSNMRFSLLSNSRRIYLDLSDFGTIAKELDIIYFVACKSAEHLNKKLEDFQTVKETLSPFILQEKLS